MQDLNLEQFSDYRSFLLSYATGMKKKKTYFNYSWWANKLGLKDTSALTKVIQGQRHPGPKMVEKFIHYFEFDSKQSEYFKDLVSLQKIKKKSHLSAAILERMANKEQTSNFFRLNFEMFSLISKWYCLAIREMVQLDTFFEDTYWMSKQFVFPVSPFECQKALEMLLKLGLLDRDNDGELKVKEAHIATDNDFAFHAIREYHSHMLDHAKDALEIVDVSEREYFGTSLIIDSSKMDEIKSFLRRQRNQFISKFENTQGDRVYHYQTQLFPITKKQETGRKQ